MRILSYLLLTTLIASTAAVAQTRSPAKMKEAQTFLTSCNDYKGDDRELCKSGQKEFVENYADAMAGRLDSWRNLAYFFAGSSEHAETFGIKTNALSACQWRMAVLFSASDDLTPTDSFRANDQCNAVSPANFSMIIKGARDLARRVKVIGEDDPKAPWAEADLHIDPKCLDSTVAPLGGPAPPPFVPPAGCPKTR